MRRYYQGGMITGMKNGGKIAKTNKKEKSDFEKKQELFKKLGVYKNRFHNDGYVPFDGKISSGKSSDKKGADIYTGRIMKKRKENEIEAKKGGILKMKKGGKSTVNKAGNYTKPTMRKALFNRIKAGGKGGRPGQWSARKAQMLAKQYKAKGGGYRG